MKGKLKMNMLKIIRKSISLLLCIFIALCFFEVNIYAGERQDRDELIYNAKGLIASIALDREAYDLKADEKASIYLYSEIDAYECINNSLKK